MISVQVTGVAQAIRRFAAVGVASEAGAWAGTQATAEAVLEGAKALVPVDTGTLHDSLQIARDGDDVLVGTNVRYAPFVEYGTAEMAAEPYLRPAADAAEASRTVGAALSAAIRAAVGL